MTKKTIVLTNPSFWNRPKLDYLSGLGFTPVVLEREDQCPLGEDIMEAPLFICNWFFYHHDISVFKNLEFIQLFSAGLDRVPLEYVRNNKISLFNARGVYAIPIAEFVVMGLLDIMKKKSIFYEQQKKRVWKKLSVIDELSNKRILIIGMGSVGQEIAKKLSVFSDDLYGIDICDIRCPHCKKIYQSDDFDFLLPQFDVVIFSVPLTSGTKHFLDSRRISRMKEGSIVVNVSRGGVVDEQALMDGLNKHLGGAVLDVFESEPLPPDSLLWGQDNVIINPHNSYASVLNDERMWELIKQNLNIYLHENEKC